MALQFVFWTILACDLVGLLLLLAGIVLFRGAWGIATLMLVPCILFLGASGLLFARSSTLGMRALAVLLVAVPLAAGARFYGGPWLQRQLKIDAAGNESSFPRGPLRDLGAAISMRDAGKVAALLPKVKVNTLGEQGWTLLGLALEQLREKPDELEVIRLLVKGGADPNLYAQALPLATAIRFGGPAAILLLLDAGADPNRRDSFGDPVYFQAATAGGAEKLKVLLDHGAEIAAIGFQGRSLYFAAVDAQAWDVVMLLVDRGLEWRTAKSGDGESFRSRVEAVGSRAVDRAGYERVLNYLRGH